MSDFPVPDGYYPPFAIVSDDDHGGWIIIATALGLAMALISTGIRVYVKWVSRQTAGMDDLLLGAGTVLAFIQESVILGACDKGLGRAVHLLSPSELRQVEKSFYVSQLLAVLALGFCKCSVASFIMRLTPQTSVRRALNVFLACVGAWMFASVMALALQCNLSSPWGLASGECTGVYNRVLLIGIFDIVLELALFGCAIMLVLRLQTRLFKKFVVVLAFGLRLPIIAFIAARISTFNKNGIENFARTETLYVVWTVTQINYSLISTTLPILRPFLKDFTTFYGALRPSEYSGSDSRSNSYQMGPFKSKRSNGSSAAARGGSGSRPSLQNHSLVQSGFEHIDFGAPRPGMHPRTHTEIEAQDVRLSRTSEEANVSHNSLGSNDSQRMIIRVEHEFQVSRVSPLPE